MSVTPEFSLSKPLYDLTTYLGRLKHFFQITNPLLIFKSSNDITAADAAIKKYRENGFMTGNSAEMWNSLNLVNCAVHPATGEIIPVPFRVSAIGPVNIPIVFMMLQIPATNVAATLLMHGANQSYNAACNYFNRSGEGAPLSSMGTAYGLAVGSACTIAFSMGKLVQKVPALQRFAIWIPLISTAMASSSNLAFTRADELKVGAMVTDEEGNNYGKSVIAGKQGVFQTALSRCVLVPCAVILLPDMMLKAIKNNNLMPKSRPMATVIQLAVIFGCLVTALPATLAIFPQTAEFETSKLESEFHHLTHKTTNQPVTKLYAQKGL